MVAFGSVYLKNYLLFYIYMQVGLTSLICYIKNGYIALKPFCLITFNLNLSDKYMYMYIVHFLHAVRNQIALQFYT